MIIRELENLKKAIKALNIPSERVKSIKICWERKFEDRAFPAIKIKLFKE